MSYDSSNLTTPDIKWLGVRPSDLDRFSIPQQCRLPMTEEDVKTGRKLVSRYLDCDDYDNEVMNPFFVPVGFDFYRFVCVMDSFT